MTKNLFHAVLGGGLILSYGTAAVSQTEVFTYDWSTANASDDGVILDNTIGVTGVENDGWERVPDALAPTSDRGIDDIIRNTGQPDAVFDSNYYTTTLQSVTPTIGFFDDRYVRQNDAAFSFQIPANAQTVDLSFVLRANRTNVAARFGLEGITVINFGLFGPNLGVGQWGVRSVDEITVATDISGAALLGEESKTYRATLSLDLTAPGPVKTIDMVVENLTDGGSEVICSDLPYNLGVNDDPTRWDELSLRARRTSIDALTVAYTIPEPSSALLLAAGCLVASTRKPRRWLLR